MKRGKSDAADAEVICEAATRPTMRFVLIKSPEQQAILCQHRTRELLIRQRTLLETIPGIGTVNAPAIVATIGSDEQFSTGRDFAAWIGLTPLKKSSGGKERLGRADIQGALPTAAKDVRERINQTCKDDEKLW